MRDSRRSWVERPRPRKRRKVIYPDNYAIERILDKRPDLADMPFPALLVRQAMLEGE